MNNRIAFVNYLGRATVIVALLMVSRLAIATVQPPPRPLTAEQISTSLSFVGKLINNSSVAKDIEQSNFAPALAYLNAARRVYLQAQTDLAENKLPEAASHRDEAIHLMMEAGHLSRLALAPDSKPEDDYNKRMKSIDALLDAHQRTADQKGLKQAPAQLKEKIAPNMKEAHALAKEGDFKEALSEANIAYAAVRNAVNELRGGETLGQLSTVTVDPAARTAADYESRLRSVNALLEAYQRIATEKSMTAQSKALNDQMKALLAKAKSSADNKNYIEANDALKVAYNQVRDALEKLRGGETLVRSLNFANAEEEYRYELDRNDTYLMLIRMLIDDKKTMAIDARVQQFLDEANARRKLAESEAEGGDYSKAIKTMEQSTQSLIQAMRNAGIFIPG